MPRDFVLRVPGRARQRPKSSKGLEPAALAAGVHGVAGSTALDILPLGSFELRKVGLVRFPSALSPMLTFGDSSKGNTAPHALSVSSRRSGALTMPPVADGSGVSPVAVQTCRDSPPTLASVQLAGRVRLVTQASRLAGFVEPKELGRDKEAEETEPRPSNCRASLLLDDLTLLKPKRRRAEVATLRFPPPTREAAIVAASTLTAVERTASLTRGSLPEG